MGRRRALLVVTGDVLKGAVPVLVARYLTGNAAVEVMCAIAAILGSTRSMFVGFKGGRGVATSVGTMLVIFPPAILVGGPVFVGVILVTRYVSLGSLLAITSGAVLVGVWWLAASGTVPFAYPVYATLGSRSGGSPTPTTSSACCTAQSGGSTSTCWPGTDGRALRRVVRPPAGTSPPPAGQGTTVRRGLVPDLPSSARPGDCLAGTTASKRPDPRRNAARRADDPCSDTMTERGRGRRAVVRPGWTHDVGRDGPPLAATR
jgi:hypothetical protein